MFPCAETGTLEQQQEQQIDPFCLQTNCLLHSHWWRQKSIYFKKKTVFTCKDWKLSAVQWLNLMSSCLTVHVTHMWLSSDVPLSLQLDQFSTKVCDCPQSQAVSSFMDLLKASNASSSQEDAVHTLVNAMDSESSQLQPVGFNYISQRHQGSWRCLKIKKQFQ